ncbi:tRNA(Arg) A34 adenosine deaminase TadA [Rhizobium esperanzae]|uniref:tRNA(Arg) A34 adenosine deaminase TadA n=1 Tax=Rhizobium esperanzae TaxID=1967781 RepID=A0A7W6W7C7_9HYPH|nr:tRNA(Arg) A34 adenosine deaminase TadA [Rhizobium esperanzae]
MENHEPFLREAIALSKSAMERGDEPFGSVLVKDGDVTCAPKTASSPATT